MKLKLCFLIIITQIIINPSYQIKTNNLKENIAINNSGNSNEKRDTTESNWNPLDTLSSAASSLGNGIKSTVSSIGNGVKSLTEKTANFGNEIINKAGSAIQTVSNKASEAKTNLQNKAADLVNSAKNNISNLGTSLKESMKSVSNLVSKPKEEKNPVENDRLLGKKPENSSDATHLRISNYINELSEQFLKTTDMDAKYKISGQLPDNYPELMRKKAKEMREDKKIWNPILDKPTEIYRTCLYPTAKVNYSKWCQNSFLGDTKKLDGCQYNFCQVCCDHLIYIYQNAAEKSLLGSLLEFNQAHGYRTIRKLIDNSTIHNCKMDCKKNYPTELPSAKTPVPRDSELGTEKKPAESCIDIKIWGAQSAPSGSYYVDPDSKGAQKVFCDMETDNGGWTLFLNYKHQPGQEIVLNENKIPGDLKSNSHMYLKNAGFEQKDVTEIRFLCTEIHKGIRKMWHFKTNNPDIIDVAFSGDQSSLKPKSIQEGYYDLKPPSPLINKYTIAVESDKINQFDVVGSSPKGGFTTTPFASSSYETYWTIKGNNPAYETFECGTSHKLVEGTNPDDNPSMVKTHHSVWFRGRAMNEDEARERFMENASK